MEPIAEAYALIHRGETATAIATLESAGRTGNADAWIELALWYLQARGVPRDLSLSRDHFERAAKLGHAQARMIHLSLVAAGVGGTADWPEAMRLLTDAAVNDEGAMVQVDGGAGFVQPEASPA